MAEKQAKVFVAEHGGLIFHDKVSIKFGSRNSCISVGRDLVIISFVGAASFEIRGQVFFAVDAKKTGQKTVVALLHHASRLASLGQSFPDRLVGSGVGNPPAIDAELRARLPQA